MVPVEYQRKAKDFLGEKLNNCFIVLHMKLMPHDLNAFLCAPLPSCYAKSRLNVATGIFIKVSTQ